MKAVSIDPGLTKSGVCFFESKNDILLHSLTLYELQGYLLQHKDCHIFVENSNLIKGNWHGATARGGVGKNKAVCQLIIQFLQSQGFDYTEVKPNGFSVMAKRKAMFEQESGWSGSSNEHERAAYYIGLAGMSRMNFETKLKQKR
jgi:hypothetical protein